MKRMVVVWSVIALAVVGVAMAQPSAPTAANQQDDKDATIAALQTRVADQQATISALLTQVSALQTAVAAATSPATAAAQPGAKRVLLDVTGSGTTTTQKFTAPGDWNLAWSYDCSSFFGGTGVFQAYIYNGDGSLSLQNSLVNQLGANGHGVEHYHHGGTFYLVVNSVCSWHITATAVGS